MLKNLHSNFCLLNDMNPSEIKSLDINISFQETKRQQHHIFILYHKYQFITRGLHRKFLVNFF